MNWYYASNGQQLGPVPEQQLSQLIAAGTINASSLVWREGLGDWQPLGVACPSALGQAHAEAPQIGGVAVPVAHKDILVQQMREGVMTGLPGNVEYGGFWIRFVAKFIDGLILMIPQFGTQALMGALMAGGGRPVGGGPDPRIMLVAFASMGVNIGIRALYDIGLVTKYGATWGKMAMGLKIVDESGAPLTMGRATGRFFGEWLSGITIGIGYIMAAFDDEKRALHDRVCSTRVIKSR